MQNLQAIFMDLDGTLLNTKHKISNADLQTLQLLGEKKIVRIVATGRSLFSCLQVLTDSSKIDYLIFANGAGVLNFRNQNLLLEKFFSREQTVQIVKRLSALEIDFQVRHKIPNSHKYFYRRFFRQNPDFDRLNRKYANCIRQLKNIEELNEATRIITIAPGEELVNQLQEEFSEHSVIRATSPIDLASVWTEIYPKNVNKGSAAEFLINSLNINFQQCAGLGNDYNDIDFLDKVKYPFVVEKSPDLLKDKYEVTVSNNNSPLSKIVSLLFKRSEN